MSILPRISICIPTFNRSDLLRKALASVSNQTVKPWEVIVVDNCSDDDTQEVARKFKDVKYFRNDINLGMNSNWNRCIELSSGDFITLLHSDDLISPTWYEQWQAIIERNNENDIGAYFSAAFTIDNNENSKIVYRVFSKETLLERAEAFKKMWKRNMCSLPSSGAIIYRKSIFNTLGKFDESHSASAVADFVFALKLLDRFRVFYTPKPLFAYRVHPFQSFDMDKRIKDDEKRYATLSRHLATFKEFYTKMSEGQYKTPLFYKRIGYMYISIAVFYLFSFQIKKAGKYYKLTKDAFPDILENSADYFRLISFIFHYIRKFIIGRIEAILMRNVAKDWIRL